MVTLTMLQQVLLPICRELHVFNVIVNEGQNFHQLRSDLLERQNPTNCFVVLSDVRASSLEKDRRQALET